MNVAAGPRSQPAHHDPLRGRTNRDFPSLTRGWNGVESLVVFVAGFLLMMFFLNARGGVNGDAIYVPEHDSWYHIKMAVMIPTHGIMQRFPWLQFAYLDPSDPQGVRFVSHHFGFQVLLMPFVFLSHALTGDYLPGARWAIAAFFGGVLMLINMLLITADVRWRWLWLAVFLMLPFQFFLRHGYIRAIAPSLMLMLLVLLMMLRDRPIAAGAAVCGYVLLYLGGVTFAPVLIGAYAMCRLFGPEGEARMPWKMLLCCCGGLLLGLLLYPYPKYAVFHFLKMQVFDTGLGADIEVGQEWKPYNNTWWVAQMTGPILAVWTAALFARLRFGPNLDARETTVLLLNFGFFLLMMKCRRFVEYWPPFAMLSAAYLFAPMSREIAAWWDRSLRESSIEGRLFRIISSLVALLVCATVLYFRTRSPAFAEAWNQGKLEWLEALLHDPFLWVSLGLVLAFFLVRAISLREWQLLPHLDRVVAVLVAFVVSVGVAGAVNARNLVSARDDLRTSYNIKAVRGALDFIRGDSKPGDIVFTDDWDDFGLYFYHNDHNYYIVGLDPKFTHERRPDLWERYVKITRAQTPSDSTVQMPQADGSFKRERIHAELADIRHYFRARYVICDRGHTNFSRQLSRDTDEFELAYPCADFDDCDDSPYLVFRVKPQAAGAQPARKPNPDAITYLSTLQPLAVSGGDPSDCFAVDQAVHGGRLRVGMETHLRGVSLSPGCSAEFELKQPFTAFEARVGCGIKGGGVPITVRVLLDGQAAQERVISDAYAEPLELHVELNQARTLGLSVIAAGPAPEGLDIAWASARLIRDTP